MHPTGSSLRSWVERDEGGAIAVRDANSVLCRSSRWRSAVTDGRERREGAANAEQGQVSELEGRRADREKGSH